MGPDGQVIAGVEYRLFRFIDMAVLPGHSYRYRVTVLCWNPNLNVPSRHLAEADLAKKTTLESPASDATAAVVVPDGKRMLVQPLKKPDLKRLKPGMVAVELLGQKPQGGALSLRFLIMEVGGVANVEPLLNKAGDPRSKGEELITDRVLLDVRGRLEDRTETRTGRPTPPPEPVEMIFLRPDGTFEFASSASSQPDIDRYLPTLTDDPSDPAAANRPAQPPPGPNSPFGNPFSPQQPGPPR